MGAVSFIIRRKGRNDKPRTAFCHSQRENQSVWLGEAACPGFCPFPLEETLWSTRRRCRCRRNRQRQDDGESGAKQGLTLCSKKSIAAKKRTEGFQRAIGKPFGRARRRETFALGKAIVLSETVLETEWHNFCAVGGAWMRCPAEPVNRNAIRKPSPAMAEEGFREGGRPVSWSG